MKKRTRPRPGNYETVASTSIEAWLLSDKTVADRVLNTLASIWPEGLAAFEFPESVGQLGSVRPTITNLKDIGLLKFTDERKTDVRTRRESYVAVLVPEMFAAYKDETPKFRSVRRALEDAQALMEEACEQERAARTVRNSVLEDFHHMAETKYEGRGAEWLGEWLAKRRGRQGRAAGEGGNGQGGGK